MRKKHLKGKYNMGKSDKEKYKKAKYNLEKINNKSKERVISEYYDPISMLAKKIGLRN